MGTLWTAYEAAAATGGTLGARGEASDWHAERLPEEDWQASGLSIDTRTIRPGEVFVAVQGARDGHDFLGQAFERGAAAALVSRAPAEVPEGKPLLFVQDTMGGLRALAEAARDRNFGRLIGVTGSAGKTSVKEMLRAALTPCGQVHAAEASFNNHLGVPLTLASLPGSADYGVFEMGMSAAGEIDELTRLVRPHVAIVTTVAAAHLEFFDGVEAIAEAKAEIVRGLRKGGVAVLPADNEHYGLLARRAREHGVARIVSFGEAAGADVRLTGYVWAEGAARVSATVNGQDVAFRLAAPGRHQAVNALAVLAAAEAAGAELGQAIEGLQTFRPGGGRGARHEVAFGGRRVTLIDEAYNANPASMRAALSVLASETPRGAGRRVAVLGEMRELGPESLALHAGLAPDVESGQVATVHTAGGAMTSLREALPSASRGAHAEAAGDLVNPLLADLRDGDVVLFKGSNGSKVGALLAALLQQTDES